jgi:hypothetical protein
MCTELSVFLDGKNSGTAVNWTAVWLKKPERLDKFQDFLGTFKSVSKTLDHNSDFRKIPAKMSAMD